MRLVDLPEDDRSARVLWSRVAEPGDVRVAALVDQHGGHASALAAVAASAGTTHEGWRRRLAAAELESDLEIAARVGARLVVPSDPEWPPSLDDLGPAAPHCLWIRGGGCLGPAVRRSVSIVGSRAATDYGLRVAADIASGLVARGFCVVSGGAFGIDAAAHRAVLTDAGITVAVLAGGVDRAYPAAHAGLLEAISDEGVVLSEVAPGAVPSRHRFLLRNRLIAALSRGTVVVEAGLRSGALSTARRAAELGRPLGAVPGPVTSVASAGCHELMREADAVVVTDAAEVVDLCGDLGRDVAPERRGETLPEDDLLPRDRLLLEAMPYAEARPLSAVATAAGLAAADARASCSRLVDADLVEIVGGLVRLSATSRARRRARAR